ncbi:hypothetical protein [Desulfosporosinus metallidurans]|uniref:Uncharacterized protein n=1 Tax=Desulfosporosinus metallidurans TaxID=1888891 RepID=A0A1Q8QFI8_9FIRM|nr:hypothetical protein [Desulfosporosinus metallidurans]OLN26068.1 hypothetical protein DSOL_5128 [Desulfosporosinus metallidurans]
MTSVLLAALSIPTVYGGIYAAAYALYYQNLMNQIISLSDQYQGVVIKVITSPQYGKSYLVQGWNDTTTAVVYLTNTDVATENVTGVFNC